MKSTAIKRKRERPSSTPNNQEEQKEESDPPQGSSVAAASGTNNSTAANAGSTEEAAPPAAASTARRRPRALWKSPRLKGYLTLVLASIINYNAAYHSNDAIFNNAIAATPTQQRYAMAVSLLSSIVSALAILAHLDRYSPLQKVWQPLFQPKSRFELALLLFFNVWWSIATGIQTSIRGIAGDGRGQYNLYFSSWVCALTSIWMLERWWVSFGWSSFSTFLSSWPHRAPGWMAMTFMSLFTLIWYVDLFKYWGQAPEKNGVLLLYQKVSLAQWEWLLFITGFTMLPGLTFVLIELFRETKTDESDDGNTNANDSNSAANNQNSNVDNSNSSNSMISPQRQDGNAGTPRTARRLRRLSESVIARPRITTSNDAKGPCENIVEGVCLLVLVAAWIPTVVLATSPGGIASLVGNSYFFTWATSVFVAETAVWWIHDWRKNIHSALAQQARDYQQKQLQVLKQSQQIQQRATMAALAHASAPRSSDRDSNGDDMDDDDNDDTEEEHKVEEGRYSPKRKSLGSEQGESSEFFDALEEITDGI